MAKISELYEGDTLVIGAYDQEGKPVSITVRVNLIKVDPRMRKRPSVRLGSIAPQSVSIDVEKAGR